MAVAVASDDMETCALNAAVGLLDALLDSSIAAVPGRNAALYAEDLRCLADSAAGAAADLERYLDRRPVIRRAVA